MWTVAPRELCAGLLRRAQAPRRNYSTERAELRGKMLRHDQLVVVLTPGNPSHGNLTLGQELKHGTGRGSQPVGSKDPLVECCFRGRLQSVKRATQEHCRREEANKKPTCKRHL